MPSTGIQWGSTNGHMQVGINVIYDSIGANTTSVDIDVEYWVRSISWGYSDPQVFSYSGYHNASANTNYTFNSPSGQTTQYKVNTKSINNVSTSYSGGPSYTFGGSVSGTFDGSAPSKSLSFTLPARPPSAPGAPVVSASSITSNSASVTCTAPGSNGASIDGYQIQVDDHSDFSSPVGTYTARPSTVSGLAPGTTYYIRARAHNSVGYSSWSTVDNFDTLPGIPSSPAAPTVSGILSTSANVEFNAPNNNGSAITQYTVQVATNTAFTTGVLTFNGTASPIAATGLTASTVYYVRVLATNVNGSSAYGAYSSFTTGATVPSAPTGLGASLINQIGATISFTPGAANGSPITSHTILVATDSGFTTNIKSFTGGSTSPVAITGLISNRLYYYKVKSTNAVGDSVYSSPSSFSTLTSIPTVTSPTSSSTVGFGYVRGTVNALGMYASSVITLEYSKSSTFASGIISATYNVPGRSYDDNYFVSDLTKYLSVGTWYVRAKVTDTATGVSTAYGATVTNVVESHTPSATLISPVAGGVTKYTTNTPFSWRFIDAANTVDVQSAYRLVVENNATGASIYDSGKLTLATTIANNLSTVNVAVGAGNKNIVLRWRVMTWDLGDTPSAWSGYELFTLADPPTVTITAPTNGGTVTTGAPTITWTNTFFAGGTQASTVVAIYDTSTGDLMWTKTLSGVVLTTTPPSVVLANSTSYYVTVSVTDTNGITGTATNNFTTSYVAPPSVPYDIDTSNINTLGYVAINWNGATPDPTFVAWKIYRRVLTESTWTLLATINNISARTYNDYLFKSGTSYIYSLTQVAVRSNTPVESAVGYYLSGASTLVDNRTFMLDSTSYWLIDADDTASSLSVPGVVSDDATLEFDSASYNIIGRGRHKDYGDELGYTGELEAHIRTGERISTWRANMETLRRKQKNVYLRTPFGRLFQVALGDLAWKPLSGAGNMDMGDMTIPYEEVR